MATIREILVPTDFSRHSESAIGYATDLARQSSARLHVIHVMNGSAGGAGRSDLIRQALERIGKSIGPEEELRLDTVKQVVEGDPYTAISKYAGDQGIDLIVMGTHGRSGLARLTLGSVTERVLRESPCPVLVVGPEIQRSIDREIEVEAPVEPLSTQSDSQAVDLIRRARVLRATDVHVDPVDGNDFLVRMRIDGKLQKYCLLDEQVGEYLLNQLKTMASLNVSEPFIAQEGKVKLPAEFSDMEIRITTAPAVAGQAVALRLFDRENVFLPLGNLGLDEKALQSVNQMLQQGEGLVLVTGPTGSGKTTTVYSMLETLGGIDKNIVSVEDPVEFTVPFVRQINVNAKHNLTMTSGLRTILRMDPDVIFLGEIRDAEAAQITLRAANSGKYALSTLHTRDVASTITALRDMLVDDHSIAANLTGIINQRLLRRLCSHCKKPAAPTAAMQERFQAAGLTVPAEVYRPSGCEICRLTGFRGRFGVFEVALIEGSVQQAISAGENQRMLHERLRSSGVATLTTSALGQVAAGITGYDEAMSVHWLT